MAAEHPLLAHQFDDLDQQRGAETLGMWVFLATEVLIFGGLFTGYFVYRSWYARDFEAVSGKLNVLIGAVNTVVLLTSSLTMALSVYAVRMGRRRMLVNCLVLTAALGTAFMVFKAIEYYSDYRDGLVPNTAPFYAPEHQQEWAEAQVSPEKVVLFLMFYYVMTGLHAVHLTIGIGIMLWLIVRARRGTLSPERYIAVEVSGLYWHFVDVVWIFLLPLLYLTGTHHLADFSHFI
ncbi:MAG TPA: cytochrome c oxidase subunit 3 family protein [Gemmataceae bacterium]|nr:cytochrome c oxidase subunit 3 family protein [Gemmataceae bacterium]